jgi:hypothetical protein
MGRTDSLAKLALAYGVHLTRRRVSRPRAQVQRLLDMYRPDGLEPLTSAEQERHPQLVGCINCGLCAFAVSRAGKTRPPDVASAYLRLYARLGDASSDLDGDGASGDPDWEAAAAACPVGVPLPEVAAMVRRLAAG